MSATDAQYQYGQLDPGCIRLLELQPNQPGELIPIRFRLHVRCLENINAYEALSYEWGEPIRQHPIQCEGRQLLVTSNLKAALTRLRLPNQSRWLWVDAVCINQEDMVERSAQVALMKQIYQIASRVLMWVGEEGPNTGSAFAMLPTMADIWRSRGADEYNMEWIADASDLPGSNALDIDNRILWKTLKKLFTCSYFTRIWILQEIVLSPSAVVLCGSYEMDWLSFQMAGHLISCCSFLPVRDMGNRLYGIRNAELMYKDGKAELATLVYLFPSFKATDPRDHIYGLLGMIDPRNIGRASPNPHAIKPDYTKTTEAIFTEAAAHILCDHGNTDLLRLARPKQLHRLGDMPSWVPDFSDISEPCNINSYNAPLADLLEGHVHNTVSSGVLSMRGIIVDTIVYTTIDFSPATVERILLNVHAEAYRSPNPYKTGESCVDALWRTLIANITLDTRKKAPLEYRQSFDTWMSRVKLEKMGLSAGVIHDNPPLRSLLTAHPELAELFPHHVKGDADVHTLVGSVPFLHKMYNSASREDEIYRVTALERLYVLHTDDTSGQCGTKKLLMYDSQASTPEDSSLSGASDNSASSQDEGRIENRSILCGRAFFITKNGYYGLGPLGRPGAVEGDTVVVPAGAYSPYVLRPIRNGRHVLVGGAYVHGINDASCLNKSDLPEILIFNLV